LLCIKSGFQFLQQRYLLVSIVAPLCSNNVFQSFLFLNPERLSKAYKISGLLYINGGEVLDKSSSDLIPLIPEESPAAGMAIDPCLFFKLVPVQTISDKPLRTEILKRRFVRLIQLLLQLLLLLDRV
jgi:hypothetical protein